MRLSISKSKNSVSLYVIKSVTIDGKRTTKIVESLGTYKDLLAKLDGEDPYEWAKGHIAKLNEQEKEGKGRVLVSYSPGEQIAKGKQRQYGGGYLFLQKLYSELGLPAICKAISEKYRFEFDLDAVLSRLIYGRVLFPSSKLSTLEQSKGLLEPPKFEIQHVYRALEYICKENALIQSELYKNSLEVCGKRSNILYYDCTNFFFEVEEASGLRQYGVSKENRPNPIVEMGLFMDGDGIPLAFCVHRGNTNEQTTLQPLEQQIMRDFDLSKFVVCTDAGLSSAANRKFNDYGDRAFITTQPLKKMKKRLTDWALSPEGWSLPGRSGTFDITKADEKSDKEGNVVYHKEQWINEGELEQRLIVTYSVKYRDYQRRIRAGQIDRAKRQIESGAAKKDKPRQTDPARFVKKTPVTELGELAEKVCCTLDEERIEKEARFDGFYAVCTNLESEAHEIAKVNQRRWEIEESFRIMKSEFEARPVYLSRDDRIEAHFTTCFISLLVYRLLEKRLGERFTVCETIDQMRQMNFLELPGEGYVPTYTRTDFTDALHEAFGFRTDTEIVPVARMKKIFKETKRG